MRQANRAANLRSVETVVGPPATTSRVECSPEERRAMGTPEPLVRYSVGVEDAEDLIANLAQALEASAPGSAARGDGVRPGGAGVQGLACHSNLMS
jgi:cystathionine gamma-synthase